MRYFLIFLLTANFFAFGQNIDYIKKMNLFDENRGYVEESGEEVDTEKEIKLPSKMPVLDGIFIAGDYKKAVFTYYDKEKRKKISRYHSPGEKFADAVLKEITPQYVILYFDGKKYKLYPDTKLKAKKSSGNYSSRVVNTTPMPSPRPESKIVSRTPSSGRKATKKTSVRKIRKNFYNRTGRRPGSKVNAVRRTPRRTAPSRKKTPKRPVNTKGVANPFAGGARPKNPSPKPKTNRTTKTPF